MSVGSRPQEALEAAERAQGMDAGQAGRAARAAAEHGPAQAARVPAAGDLPAQPPQVRAHRQRGAQDRQAAPHQGGRQGPHRPHLPRRIHGSVHYLLCRSRPVKSLYMCRLLILQRGN